MCRTRSTAACHHLLHFRVLLPVQRLPSNRRALVMPLPSEMGTTWTCVLIKRPESGRDCLTCATFARQRSATIFCTFASCCRSSACPVPPQLYLVLPLANTVPLVTSCESPQSTSNAKCRHCPVPAQLWLCRCQANGRNLGRVP